MRELKDSGVEWIGEIPAGWEVRKVKHYYKMQTGFTPDTSKQDFYDDENGFDWVNISDLSSCRTIASTKNKISQLYINTHYPQIIPKGSLLYSFKLSVGQVAFAGKDLYSNEAIASFVFNKSNNLNFLYYSSYMIVNNANENIYGAKLLNQELIKNAYILFPPLPTQQRIADYLDNKCAKIDAIIAHERTVIEKLKEYKMSLITETVTKGLNPNVKMKDSGIEWIGEIPEEWGIEKLKTVFTYAKGLPITKADLLEQGIAVISYGQIHSKKSTGLHISDELIRYVSEDYLQSNPNSIAYYGDILFADTSEDYLGIGNCIYNDYNNNIFAGYHTIITRPIDNRVFSKYQAFLFKSDVWRSQIRSLANGIKVYSITQKMLNRVSIILPPRSEQQEIVNYLDQKCSGIDAAIAKKQSVIDKITEYKKSLIYEVVTGKKEV